MEKLPVRNFLVQLVSVPFMMAPIFRQPGRTGGGRCILNVMPQVDLTHLRAFRPAVIGRKESECRFNGAPGQISLLGLASQKEESFPSPEPPPHTSQVLWPPPTPRAAGTQVSGYYQIPSPVTFRTSSLFLYYSHSPAYHY